MTATCCFHLASTSATWCCTHGLLRHPQMIQWTVVEPWETCNSQLIEQRIHLHYLFFCQPLFSLTSGLLSFHFCSFIHFPTSIATTATATAPATTATTTAATTSWYFILGCLPFTPTTWAEILCIGVRHTKNAHFPNTKL